LNVDPTLPGLSVPTVGVPEASDQLPPIRYSLDEGERGAIVVLADDYMAADPPSLPPNRSTWGAFAADLRERCADGKHRFIPIQLTPNAFPLDDRLAGVNFLRAHLQPADAVERWIMRGLLIELLRFELGHDRGVKVPIKVFLSHAKQDIGREPKVFSAILEHLKASQPVDSWIDSGEIETGSSFGEQIEAGVDGSAAVLVLATEHYSSREWCRREVLFAKEKQKPVVVVEALKGVDIRRFTYLANVPVISWGEDSASAEAAVTLLLKETLRQRLVLKKLATFKEGSDVVLMTPPELLTATRIPKNARILYPDPALGDEEIEPLTHLGYVVETPLQRVGNVSRTLEDWTIALSISESDDFLAFGVTKPQIDAALLELTQQLLVRGASLAYGGHLGEKGYTALLFEFVRCYKARTAVPPIKRICLYYGWPMPLTVQQRAEYARQAQFIVVPRPDGVEDLEPATFVAEPTKRFEPDSPERRYAWARGMTAMRERQTAGTHARVILGGESGPTTTQQGGTVAHRWYAGRIPGVLEEAMLTLEAKTKPLYVCGGFGGVAAVLADALVGRVRRELTWDFHRQAPHAQGMRDLYEKRGVAFEDYSEMADKLAAVGTAGLAAKNGLTVEENTELFRTRDPYRILTLVLAGLCRLEPPAGG
jgi:hypothetical protein